MTSPHRTLYLCPSDRAARAFQSWLARDSFAPAACTDFEHFCAELWRRGQLFGLIADSRELLDATATAALWQSVVTAETNLTTAEVAHVASLAADAWALAHRYGLAIRQIASLASGQDNQALFARCATRIDALLRRIDALTQSELCAQLLLRLDALQTLLPQKVVLTPSFTAHAGQRRLLEAFTARGISVTQWVAVRGSNAVPYAHEFTDERQEMQAAIAWAKARRTHAVGTSHTVAIIVPNLSQCRTAWLNALREHLNPDLWWLDPESDRAHFNLSIGQPLAAVPWVASLLTALDASIGSVDTEALAQALSHPRWGTSPATLQRLQGLLWRMLERGADRCTLRDWMNEYVATQHLSWDSFFRRTEQNQPRSRAWHSETVIALSRALTERAWIAQSELFQLQEAWSVAIRRWVDRDRWLAPVTWREAVREISGMAGQQTFQPEAGKASIQVMGLLESAGVPLDAAWIVGMTDRVLPEAYKPHPMLPRAWQAAEQVGLGSRDEVRRRANALWSNWNLLCGELHVSYASDMDGSAQRISPLAADASLGSAPPLIAAPMRLHTSARASVALDDERLPPAMAVMMMRSPLSSSIIEMQAHCPRKAAAARLHLREWPEYAVGITARLRGDVVHQVMHVVGKTRIQHALDYGDEATLERLRDVAAEAFDLAVSDAQKKRPSIPQSVWLIERNRLLPLIDKVLALDAARHGFTVVAVEEGVQAQVLGTSFKLRLDRRDTFAAESVDARYGVVLDYKTGQVSRADLFPENSSGRLAAPQLPLYVFALHASLPASEPRIGAIGYVVISDDDVKFVGVGADASLNPKRPNPGEPDWYDLTLAWRDQLDALLVEHREGVADVAPLKGVATCRYCSYAGFCRESWSLSGARDSSDDDGDSDAGQAT